MYVAPQAEGQLTLTHTLFSWTLLGEHLTLSGDSSALACSAGRQLGTKIMGPALGPGDPLVRG